MYETIILLNFELFLAKRITLRSERTFSKLIVRIAITGIALGLAVMIIALAVVSGFKSAIKDKIYGFAGHVQIRKVDLNNTPQNASIHVDAASFHFLDTLAGIRHHQRFATKIGIIKSTDEIEPMVLKGVSSDYDWSFLQDKITSGRVLLTNDSAHRNDLLISAYFARRMNLKTGDAVILYFAERELRVRKMKITGIYETGVEDLDKLYLFCDLSVVQKLNNWSPDEVGGIEVFAEKPAEAERLRDEINDELGIYSQAKLVRDLYPQLFDWLELMDVNGRVIIILMLLVAGINMISALLIMILERTNMIGILKAMGAYNASIRKVFLYNALYLVGVGLLAGNLIGVGFVYVQHYFRWVKLDQESYFVSYVPVHFSLPTIILLNIGTVACCFLMMIVPSLLVSRISPLKAIRFK